MLKPGEIERVDYEVSDRCKFCNQDILFMESAGLWFAQDQKFPRNVFACIEAPRPQPGVLVMSDTAPRHAPEIVREVDRGMIT